MTAQDFEDYAEASLLHDTATTHSLACQAETDRMFYGDARRNTASAGVPTQSAFHRTVVKGGLDTGSRKA